MTTTIRQTNTTLFGFQFTRFDLLVFGVALLLAAAVALTAFIGIREEGVRVAYLKLSDGNFYQVWIANPESENGGRQITSAEFGVNDFDVSSDGQFIAYSERDFSSGVADLYLLNLGNNAVSPLTNCIMQDSDCTAPAFQPGGELIAYERLERNTGLSTGTGSTRIWMIDLSSNPPSTYPLFDDSQILGYGAEWSDNGEKLAFYDSTSTGIVVYDFAAAEGEDPIQFIPSSFGTVGTLSPDGTQMIFPELIVDGIQTRAVLQLADLENNLFQELSDPNDAADDQFTAWSPDGQFVALGRVYRDERFTRGAQIYLMDMQDGEVSPLVFDPAYANGFFSWSPDGAKLTMQRFQQLDENGEVFSGGTTEVWTYDLESRTLTRIDDNAIRPRWVPAS